jgi:mannose-6-phosphate isomerase-like protein (cupin superfamily)
MDRPYSASLSFAPVIAPDPPLEVRNSGSLTSGFPSPEPNHCRVPILKPAGAYPAFRISPEDQNRIAIVFDPTQAEISLALCVEIFEPGGHTPHHRHPMATEMFFILQGEGTAFCDGKSVALKAGDSLLVPPNANHALHNTGDRRLYALCLMVPNEDFIELIRQGTPVELDAEDLAVLQGLGSWGQHFPKLA